MSVCTWTSPDNRIEIRHCDARDLLASLAPKSVDAFVTDPPYGIAVGAAFVRGATDVIADGDEAMNLAGDDPFWWLASAGSALVDGGHLAQFINAKRRVECETACVGCGLPRWMTYYVVNNAPPPTPRPTFASAVQECIISARPGVTRRWHGGGCTSNAWVGIPATRDADATGHTAQKPVGAMGQLVKALCPPDGLVCDPFLGSGTTAVACINHGRRFVGCEREAEWFDKAVKRVKRHLAQGRLL